MLLQWRWITQGCLWWPILAILKNLINENENKIIKIKTKNKK